MQAASQSHHRFKPLLYGFAHVLGHVHLYMPVYLSWLCDVLQLRGDAMTPALEEQLCFEIKTFLLAGHETSAAMLSWTLFELARHPQGVQQVSHVTVLCWWPGSTPCRDKWGPV